MVNIIPPQFAANSIPRRLQHSEVVTTVRGVWQDNPALPHERTATPQPELVKTSTRARQKDTQTPQTQKQSRSTRKSVQVIVWVKPVVKAELQRIAEQEGLSVSATGAALLEKALQQNLHSQHTTLLETVIEKAIGRHMRAYSTRIAVLLVRSLFATEQIRSIVTNILGRQDGMTQHDLATIITASENKARGNITRITPQLKTLIEAVQSQFAEGVSVSA